MEREIQVPENHCLLGGGSTMIGHDGAKVQRESRFSGTLNFKLENRDHTGGGGFNNPIFQSDIKTFSGEKVRREDILWCKATLFSRATAQ